ncbi:MAG: hypothetical protein GXO78_04105 [Calditrichaeota bacterium]|nr:hypothetical protein [Calditrichota bacterium]
MDTVEVITLITYIFFVVLVLATFVERALEIAMAGFKYLEFRLGWAEVWNRLAVRYARRLDRLYGLQGSQGQAWQRFLDRLFWRLVSESPVPGGRRILSARLIRLNYLRVITRLVAFGLSLILVLALKIDLIEYIIQLLSGAYPQVKIISSIIESKAVHYGLTALAISIGTEPLHQFLVRIEELEKRRRAKIEGGQS